MNDEHLRLCASAEWAALVRDDLLPWVLGDDELGDDVLEVGAGPGLVTDLLVDRAPRVTAVEIDERLASALRTRLAAKSVEVVTADATDLPLPDDQFSAAACFTMLHHIPGRDLQDRALAEIARVLRPGGLLLGTDGEDTPSPEPCTTVTSSSRSTRPVSPTVSGPPVSTTRWSTATATASASAPGRGRGSTEGHQQGTASFSTAVQTAPPSCGSAKSDVPRPPRMMSRPAPPRRVSFWSPPWMVSAPSKPPWELVGSSP